MGCHKRDNCLQRSIEDADMDLRGLHLCCMHAELSEPEVPERQAAAVKVPKASIDPDNRPEKAPVEPTRTDKFSMTGVSSSCMSHDYLYQSSKMHAVLIMPCASSASCDHLGPMVVDLSCAGS